MVSVVIRNRNEAVALENVLTILKKIYSDKLDKLKSKNKKTAKSKLNKPKTKSKK